MAEMAKEFLDYCQNINVGYSANLFLKRLRNLFGSMPINRSQASRYFAANAEKIAVSRNSILFESFWGRKVACHPLAVFKQMLADGDLTGKTVVWVRNRHVPLPFDSMTVPSVSFVEHGSLEYADALARAEVLISNSTFPSYFWRKPGQIYINTWHGIPLKKMGLDSDRSPTSAMNVQRNFLQCTHIVLACSYAAAKIVKPYGMFEINSRKIVLTGSPRLDCTIHANVEQVKVRLGIPDTKPVILYAPTWRGHMKHVDGDIALQLEAVEALTRRFDRSHHILVSLHNFVTAKLPRLPENVRCVSDAVDINEILAAVDVLVTDYSSVLFDYLVLDRPLVLHVPDRLQYESERGVYLALEDLPATLTSSCADLVAAVNAAAKPSTFASYGTTLNTFFELEDGAAARRVARIAVARKALPRKSSGRLEVLMYPGALRLNGITACYFNLVAEVSKAGVRPSTIVDVASASRSKDKMRFIERLNAFSDVLFASSLPAARWTDFISIAKLTMPSLSRAFSGNDANRVDAYLRQEASRIVGNDNFDVAIDYGGYSPKWARLMALVDARRREIYQHNDLYAEWKNAAKLRNQRQLQMVFRAYKKFDHIVAVSKEIRDVNKASLGHYYETAKATWIDNLVDLHRIRAEADKRVDWVKYSNLASIWDSSALRLVYVGRLSPEKNVSRLLNAFARMQRGSRACLAVIGDGPLRGDLERQAAQLGLNGLVHFTGSMANPLPLVKAADCMVLPSDYEGQPTVLLEALALGVKIVATNTPGSRSVLSGGKGLLVDCSVEGVLKGMEDIAFGGVDLAAAEMDDRNRQALARFLALISGDEASTSRDDQELLA